MSNKNTLIIIVAAVAVVAGAAAVGAILGGVGNPQTAQEAAASSTVVSFGKTLQQVSILAPDASSTIASAYAPYVDPALLKQWEANPRSAPGRVVSSPWPDRIEIDSVTPQGTGFVVNGRIVFMSGTSAVQNGSGTAPVVIQLVPENGALMIVAFQSQGQQP